MKKTKTNTPKMGVEQKLELLKKMEAGDVNACVELSIQAGLMSEDDRAFIKKYEAMDKDC